MSITIPNNITKIEPCTFCDCTSLTSINIPNNVTEIGYGAFQGCRGLTSFIIPKSVTKISESTFYGCTGLTSITIPNSVTEIGVGAFEDCNNLTSINIPNSVTKIGGGAFTRCTGLKSINIPNSVTEIGAYTFYGCTSLTSINIPNSVTQIITSAFRGCTGLTSVTIGEKVEKIFGEVFENCPLRIIKSLNPTPPRCYDLNNFSDDAYKNAVLYVPSESVEAYKNADVWSNFQNIMSIEQIVPAENVTVTAQGETSLKEGETVQLTATVAPDNATDKSIVWSSSDVEIATVSADGLVTAHGKTGNVTITAICGSVSGTIEISVQDNSSIDSIFADGQCHIRVFDIFGHMVYDGPASDFGNAVIVRGIYVVTSKNGETYKIAVR